LSGKEFYFETPHCSQVVQTKMFKVTGMTTGFPKA